MGANEWLGPLAALLLALAVAALARFGLRRERYACSQLCVFTCPRYRDPATCELVQDVRTGQFKDLRSCSEFARGDVPCEWDCVKQLNQGTRLPGWRQRLLRFWGER